MVVIHNRITIVTIRKPSRKNINEELQWLGSSLGLFNLRDKDKSCFRIFIELVKSAKTKKPLTSDDIAANLSLSRGTVIHHIRKLIDAGIVVHNKNQYLLRVDSVQELIKEVEKDLQRSMDSLKDIASDIDGWLGL